MRTIINYLIFLFLFQLNLISSDSLSFKLDETIEFLEHRFDEIEKKCDDVLMYFRFGNYCFIDKVFICGPAKANSKNTEQIGAKNPLKFWSYVFIPKALDLSKKYPLIVLPHGGVHSNFDTYYTHIIRELIAQGYIIIAPEYRGSTGYGKTFYEAIDYGGLEVEDCLMARDYMCDNYSFVDENRIGIIGWSHGGMIALLNVFKFPDKYNVAFAGVPVSDLIMRMGYHDEEYRNLFSADYHIGKKVWENIEEYKKRSPVWNASKLKTPLLIYTNTNDDDVYSIEVEHLIQALKVEGKKFEYEIFNDAPGGHSFDRIDIKNARQIRLKIYKFLSEYLKPPKLLKTLQDIEKASYLEQ